MTMKKRMKRWTAWCTNPNHDIWRVDDYDTAELRGFMKAESEAIDAFAEIGMDASVYK